MNQTKKEIEARQAEKIRYWENNLKSNLIEELPKKIRRLITENDAFFLLENFKQNLFFVGKSGTGKTTEAYFKLISWHMTAFANSSNKDFIFIKVPVLLEKLRELSNDIEAKNEYLYKLKRCGLLVLDDFGACQMTDWATQMLYIIIDYRYDEEKTTWYTSNFDLQTLAEMTGDDRITRRIGSQVGKNILIFENTYFL